MTTVGSLIYSTTNAKGCVGYEQSPDRRGDRPDPLWLRGGWVRHQRRRRGPFRDQVILYDA